MIVAEPFIVDGQKDEQWWLEHYLSLWSSWMRSKEDLPEGCPSEASGGAENYTSLTDFDDMIERMDCEHAQTTHVAIWRLPESQRNAIYFERGLIRLLQMVRYEIVLLEAKAALMVELKKLGLLFGY